MKILHVLGSLKLPRDPDQDATGGVTRVAVELAKQQRAAGHQVTIVTVGEEPWRLNWRGISLVTTRSMPRARVRVLKRTLDYTVRLPLILFSRRYHFDVVHAHEYINLRFMRGSVRIVHLHNDPFWSRGSQYEYLQVPEFRAIARCTDAQVAVSQFVAEQLRAGFATLAASEPGRTIRNGTINSVHNGADSRTFSVYGEENAARSLRREWGLDDETVVFLFAGAVTPDKGVIQLARAFDRLYQEGRRVFLAVAGSAALWEAADRTQRSKEHEYEHSVHEALALAGSRGCVRFLGIVPRLQMPAIYAASDVVVLPSLVKEACPLTLLEAIASGKPVIASNTGGIPELVGGGTGILVEAGDEAALLGAMRSLSANPATRRSLGAKAAEKAKRFTWERSASELESLYGRLLATDTHGVAAGHA